MPKLPPPLRETRWIRFKAFLRGLLLYNTVYWRRASDGVNRSASRVSRAERERSRPQIDPDVLRPRVQPRARSLRGLISLPPPPVQPGEQPSLFLPPAPAPAVSAPPPPESSLPSPAEPEPPLVLPPEAERRRRRVLRRKQPPHAGIDPARVFSALRNAPPDATGSRKGWLKRLLNRGKDF